MTTSDLKIAARMDCAIKLRNKGHIQEALNCLLPHAGMLQSSAPACGLIATLFFDRDQFQDSAHWYAKATALAPRSEMASLGLFHSQWSLGKHDEAFDEMRRFAIFGQSNEYTRVLRELKKELASHQMSPAKLPMEEQYAFLEAEHAGLDWRASSTKLAALDSRELEYA